MTITLHLVRFFLLLIFSGSLWAANVAPSATWLYPDSGTIYDIDTPFEFYVAAKDTDGSVSKVELYNGNSLITTIPSSQVDNTTEYGPVYYHTIYLPAGNYNLSAKVTDNLGAVTNTTPISIVVYTSTIDLAISNFNTTTLSIPAGNSFNIDNTESNFGNTPVNTSHVVKFYLSADATWQSTDYLIGSRTITSLAARSANTATTNVTVPINTPAGNYYLILFADANNNQVETIETNNVIVSNGTLAVTPAVIPGPPTIGTAVSGDTQVTVNFNAPTITGSSAITSYTATSSLGNISKTGTSSPIIVTGLTNGTAYTFTVKASNTSGTGPSSAASNSVIPSRVPAAPTMGTATAGNQQATISFTAPIDNGGAAISKYTVTATHSTGSLSQTTTASPFVFTGLSNGIAYTFTVTATNIKGNSPASAASNSIKPAATGSVPSAPTIGTATSGNTQVIVNFTAPTNTGGYPISSYKAVSTPGNFSQTGTTTPITVSGLSNGTAYTFKVTAFNSMGPSAASLASNSVTPSTVPSAPTIGTAVAGNTQATINFLPPTNNGGAAISSYTVTATHSTGTLSKNGTASPIIFTGLTNGTAYTFTVKANNIKGSSIASAASNSITPATTAGAKVYYIHADHLNTPRQITDTAGNKRWEWTNSDPYGANAANENPAALGAFTFNLRFPGQYYDKETGLHYNWFRTYDPGTGRYIESDPIGLDGGVNTYAYAGGNPLSFVDPNGWCIVLGAGGSGGALGAGGAAGGGMPISSPPPNNSLGGFEMVTGGNSSPPPLLVEELKKVFEFIFAQPMAFVANLQMIVNSVVDGKTAPANGWPQTRDELHKDLLSKGYEYKGTSEGGGYATYKGPDGRIVTVKPTGEVIVVQRVWKEDGTGKFPQRQDYDGKTLPDQSHSTGHFVK